MAEKRRGWSHLWFQNHSSPSHLHQWCIWKLRFILEFFFLKKKTQQQWCARQTINISGHTSQEKILNWNTWSRVFRLHSRSRIPKHSLISTAREITLIIKNYKHFRVMSHQKLSWKALWPKRYNQSTWWKRSKIEPNKPRLPYIGAPVTRGSRVTDR